MALDPGEGGDVTTGSYDISEGPDYGTNICVSQWGYAYNCIATTPSVSLSTTSLALPQTFINQQVQASFTIWNGGGGRLTGTITAPAPFSIVSGGSFSLLPGQPQQVTVKFSSTTAGSFSQNLTITSNAGTKLMPVSGVAHKVTFSPATVNFGEGLFVVTQQCGGETGECMPYTKKVGLPLQGKLVVKNEGSVAVSLNLSTSAPFYLPNGGSLTVAAGQSVEVAVRFDPADSGAFTGVVQVGLQGGQGSLTSGPLTGTAHKIEASPAALNFFALVEGPAIQQALTIKNQGMTAPSLIVSAAEPFSVNPSSFTLAAGESKDVTVQFSPPTSGEFSSTISIKASQMQTAFTVPVKGRGITEAEFYQWLSEMSQAGPIDAVIPTDDVSVVLQNFRDLTPTAIQALVDLAKTERWDSLEPIGIDSQPDDWGKFWWDQFVGYLIGKVFDLLMPGGKPNEQQKQSVISSLESLVNAYREGELSFSGLYTGLKDDTPFRSFLDTLKEIIDKSHASSFFDPSGNIDEAVYKAIKEFCKVFGSYTRTDLENMYANFGPAGVFAVAAAAKLGSGVHNKVIDGFLAIALTQSYLQPQSNPWYQVDKDNTLWSNLVAALMTIGAAAAHPEDLELQRRFNATIAALGVTATMAANGWAIFAFRAKAYYGYLTTNPITVDVVGVAQINGTKVAVFGQFFHAVTGFDRTQLEELLRAVAMLSLGSQGGINFLNSLFPGLINNAAYRNVHGANLFGVVAAVKQQDETKAVDLVESVINDAKSDKFFAILIVVNDNQIITNIVIRGNIDPAIAKEILDSMGIYIGNKMPDPPRIRLIMMMLMMSLGMVQ